MIPGAEEGWRRVAGLTVWETKKCYIRSRSTEISHIQ